jgi:uncharacterized RDD family membrane protein YckC
VVSTEQSYPGQRFGLPEVGIGSVASMGRRVSGFVIDIVLCAILAFAFTWPAPPGNLSLYIWAGMTAIAVGMFGFTPGHAAVGIRVAPIGGASIVGLWAILRTLLVFLLVPPLLADADGRGLHDRLCRTVVIRMR